MVNKEFENVIVIPLKVVKVQSGQIVEFANASNLNVNKIDIRGLDMEVFTDSDINNVEYFKYLMNSHIQNINKLERISNRK